MDKKIFSIDILKYWYFVEFMSQPDWPYQDKAGQMACSDAQKGNSKRKKITVFETLPHDFLFSESAKSPSKPITLAQLINGQNKTYRWHPAVSDEIELCFGKIERSIFAKSLERISDKKINSPEKKKSVVSILGLKCNQDGSYIPGSLNVSPLLWGTYRLITAQKVTDYTTLLSTDAYNADMETLETLLLSGENCVGEQLTGALFTELAEMIDQKYFRTILDTYDSVRWDGLMISRRYTTEDVKAEDSETYQESELSKGFFSEDLLMVSHALANGEFGGSAMQQAILNYICGPYAKAHPELERSDTDERIDIFDWKVHDESAQMDFFHDRFDITNAPLGKWPSRFRPALMQQLAINSCWSSIAVNQAIFSVNGPPGTGKTTLLKEIIAGNIVARAYKLAQYAFPDQAFEEKFFQDGDKPHNGYSRFHYAYYSFKDNTLKDYGMLVASCNNSAVENITKELPDGSKLLKDLIPDKNVPLEIEQGLREVQRLFEIDAAESISYKVWNDETKALETVEHADIYFTKLANDLATSLVRNASKEAHRVEDCWGLISAPLGKRSNLKCYINAVLKPYAKSFVENDFIESNAKEYPEVADRFLKQYQIVADLEHAIQKVSGARSNYLSGKAEFTSEITQAGHELNKLVEVEQGLEKEIQELCKAIKELERELAFQQEEALVLRSKKSEEEKIQRKCETEIDDLHKQIIKMEQSRRFWDYVLELLHRPTMLSRDIQEKYTVLDSVKQELQKQMGTVERVSQQLDAQQELCATQKKRISKHQTYCNKLMERKRHGAERQDHLLNQVQACYLKMEEALSEYRAILKEAVSREPAKCMNVLDEEFASLFNSTEANETCKAHILNPWQSAEYDREREKLFFEALRLHKAFLLGSKCCLWNFKNLLLFWNEPGDDKKPVQITRRDRETAFGELLNTVFLLTPVLSTTFASVETMLKDIKNPGEIGCLIIDEAGQAAPQMAVGALYRSRRAIVVGDPKQVEPVVTNELDLIKRIVRNDSTQYYQDKTLSVQGLADSLNNIGTYYSNETEKLWVGCPLVVHRRCISPMFDISNALSYNGIMKQQTKLPDSKKEATFCKENSGWINVCGSEQDTAAKNHYVQTQGKKAWELVLKAFEKACGIPSLFVITPFASVKEGFYNFIKKEREYKDNPLIQKWADNCIGTVHTFQGKEADQVIFLLGCDKNAISAVKWVNTNIVNVAVTRAKFRLYVIGDYLVWKESELFCKVKSILDSYAIRILYTMADNGNILGNRARAEYLLRQIPDAESFTVDGEPDEQLLSPLFGELSLLLKNKELTTEQLGAFNLSKEDIAQLSGEIKNRLLVSILQHSILTEIKRKCEIELNDASGTGVMFCKLMETMVKKQFLEKFKTYFSEQDSHRKTLAKPYDKVTIGTFTNILREEICQQILASKGAVIFGSVCDLTWWDDYGKRLIDFKDLRNACCHSEPFGWDQYEQMLNILFEQREFMNTLVGDVLPM